MFLGTSHSTFFSLSLTRCESFTPSWQFRYSTAVKGIPPAMPQLPTANLRQATDR